MKIDEIRNLLANEDINPMEIKMLNIQKPLYDKQAVYLLYFKPGTTNLPQLRQTKHLNHISVKWEKFHPRTYDKIPQCRNCQKLGHSSVNCYLPSRCVVCAGEHKTEELSLIHI